MHEPETLPAPLTEAGVLSEKEQRFDMARQRVGLILGPLVFIALWFFPIPGLSENREAHRLLAIMGLVVTFWISEAIPLAITALLGPSLCVVAGIAPVREIFKSFADPIIFVFMGSFLLAEAIFHHGLNRRIAFQILGWKLIGANPSRLLLAFGVITFVMSMWISNTTTTAMMLPVGISILKEMARRRSEIVGHEIRYTQLRYGTGLMLMMVFGSTLGGLATPVGTPPNLIGIGMIQKSLDISIPFFKWMIFGLPIATILTLFLMFYLNRFFPAEKGLMGNNLDWIKEERSKFLKLNRGEKNVLIAFGFTVTFWLMPGLIALVFGTDHSIYKTFIARFPESTVAILGAVLLFLLPVNFRQREFTLTWNEAKRIDWGIILLFGGGIALGDLMFSTGLAEWTGHGLVNLMNTQTTLGLVVLFSVLAAVITQGASNTASASMVIPVSIAVSQAAGVNPLLPAIAASFSASLGCMLPVSTPPNAIAYGSGSISLMQMVKHGFVLMVVGIAVIDTIVMLLVPRLF